MNQNGRFVGAPEEGAKPKKMLNESLTIASGFAAFLAVSLWGGNTVSIKIATAGMPPGAIAAVRFILGAAAVFAYAVAAKIPMKLNKRELPSLLLLAGLFIVQILTLNIGTSITLAAHATVLISSYPFLTVIFAHVLIPGDRMTKGKVLGMAISFLGVSLIFYEGLLFGSAGSLLGDLIVLVSCILLGLRQVVTKRMTQGMHPVKLVYWQSVFSVPVFILFSLLFERSFPLNITPAIGAAVLYQGLVVAGLCFILMATLLRRYNAGVVSSFSFFTPLVGVFLSGVLLGEPLSPWLIISLVLIAAGILVVNGTSTSEGGTGNAGGPVKGEIV